MLAPKPSQRLQVPLTLQESVPPPQKLLLPSLLQLLLGSLLQKSEHPVSPSASCPPLPILLTVHFKLFSHLPLHSLCSMRAGRLADSPLGHPLLKTGQAQSRAPCLTLTNE